MPLGREVDVGPGDIMLDGDPAPPEKGHSTPTFRLMSIVAKKWPISATAQLLFYYRSVISRVIFVLIVIVFVLYDNDTDITGDSGVGWGMFAVSMFTSIYYNMIIAWCFFYMFASFASDVPWRDCNHDWNSPGRHYVCTCRDIDD